MSDNRIYSPYQPLNPAVSPSNPAASPGGLNPNKITAGPSFNQILEQEIAGVKFSQHALQRLNSRKIQLDSSQLSKLNQAVDKAAQKGAKESLILMSDNLAFVVSVKNKTVITAIDGASIKDNVFTNIDSAVII
ncbi:TIGR02530 family flagellar biosynthesis protein [Sporomusa sp.]|jgi:flagellar operon protein|uniref:TIGR02530 family flagellar biosynthesis protein n=1 Tax=Sporomusa sp. TaxID=2078658 RepID=UPI002D16DCB7|nr:TIGR02530 family flagellar biosynthesis protein [Sporomusa sp.]MDF2873730.1 flagellar operon protein [Sporomusa sp.]HWR05341.1 TIGR02530 family flagellar biosynthesis protein [Sporomusa sp.]